MFRFSPTGCLGWQLDFVSSPHKSMFHCTITAILFDLPSTSVLSCRDQRSFLSFLFLSCFSDNQRNKLRRVASPNLLMKHAIIKIWPEMSVGNCIALCAHARTLVSTCAAHWTSVAEFDVILGLIARWNPRLTHCSSVGCKKHSETL